MSPVIDWWPLQGVVLPLIHWLLYSSAPMVIWDTCCLGGMDQLWVKSGEKATSSVHTGDVELQCSCFHSPTPHKQLHIWAGWDAFGEQKGGWGPTAWCVNEWGPEGDPARQAPVVLLAVFQSRLNVFQCLVSAFSGHLWQPADMLCITGERLGVRSSFLSLAKASAGL